MEEVFAKVFASSVSESSQSCSVAAVELRAMPSAACAAAATTQRDEVAIANNAANSTTAPVAFDRALCLEVRRKAYRSMAVTEMHIRLAAGLRPLHVQREDLQHHRDLMNWQSVWTACLPHLTEREMNVETSRVNLGNFAAELQLLRHLH
eukprot:4826957-Amphidinium_carterae.1